MLDSIKNLLIGDMDEKRAYKRMMKRVNALPEDYRFTFHKIQKHMFTIGLVGDDIVTIFTDLVDLFEASAAEGRQVLDVTGNDVAAFAGELASGSDTYTEKLRQKINKEIMDRINKEGQLYAGPNQKNDRR